MSGAATEGPDRKVVQRLIIGLIDSDLSKATLAPTIRYIESHSGHDLTELKIVLLFAAVIENERSIAARCLVEWKVSPNALNSLGQTPLHVLMEYDHASPEWINFFREHGTDLHIRDQAHHSVFDAAAEHGRKDCLACLLEHEPRYLSDQAHARPVYYLELLTRPFAHIALLPRHIDTFCYLLARSPKEEITSRYGMDLLYFLLTCERLNDEEGKTPSKLGLARLLCHEYDINPCGKTMEGKSLTGILREPRPSPGVATIILALSQEWKDRPHRASDPSSVESGATESAMALHEMGDTDDRKRKESEDSTSAATTEEGPPIV